MPDTSLLPFFDWRPGVLEWALVTEFIALGVLAVYRYIGHLLRRSSPTDPFVIFYRVFWSAVAHPSRYPVPVNYQPVLPRERKVRREDAGTAGGLTDDELEQLMAEAAGHEDDADDNRPGPRPSPAPVPATPATAPATPPRRPVAAARAARPAAPRATPTAAFYDADLPRLKVDDDDPPPSPPPARRPVAAEDEADSDGDLRADFHVRLVPATDAAAAGVPADTLVPVVLGVQPWGLTVAVRLPPDDGRCNALVIGLVCRLLDVERHQVFIAGGHTRSDKALQIRGMRDTMLQARLAEAAASLGDAP